MGEWRPISTVPESGEFLLAVWEGEWREPRQRYRIYHAFGYRQGPSWSMRSHYRIDEGGSFELVGWMPLPEPPRTTESETP